MMSRIFHFVPVGCTLGGTQGTIKYWEKRGGDGNLR